MMSLRTLAVNIGNSRIACALMQSNLVLERCDHATPDIATLAETLGNCIRSHPERILIASVVPQHTESVRQILATLFAPLMPSLIHHSMVPLVSEYAPTESLGIDRLLSGYAGFELYGKPAHRGVLVIDLGTATTFNCISEQGVFLGGAISLGIHSTFRALRDQTAQLGLQSLSIPSNVLAKSTSEGIRSGVFFAAILGIRGVTTLLMDEVFSEKAPIVLHTGGSAGLLSEYLGEGSLINADLVLRGIALLPDIL